MTTNIFENGGKFYQRKDTLKRPVEWHQWANGWVSYMPAGGCASYAVKSDGLHPHSNGDGEFDLLPYPPRYTVSLDPRTRGILDAETPGEFAEFLRMSEGGIQHERDGLNDGDVVRDDYKWTKIPPRFTVSVDPCGVLDSERPGMYCDTACTGYVGGALRRHTQGLVSEWNEKPSLSDEFDWQPIKPPPAPVMVPLGPEDVTPGVTLIRGDSEHQSAVVLSKSECGICVGTIPLELKEIETVSERLIANFVSYGAMKNTARLYSNDHGKTWSACSKPSASSSGEPAKC